MAQPTLIDMLQICNRARTEEIEQYEALTGMEWDVESVVNVLFNKPGVKYALLDGEIPFSIGGWEPVIDGVWQSWMVGTVDNWSKYWRNITTLSRKTAELLFASGQARRLQIAIMSSRKKPCEWCVRGLKFSFEGTMRNFGIGGEDVSIYVRFKE